MYDRDKTYGGKLSVYISDYSSTHYFIIKENYCTASSFTVNNNNNNNDYKLKCKEQFYCEHNYAQLNKSQQIKPNGVN